MSVILDLIKFLGIPFIALACTPIVIFMAGIGIIQRKAAVRYAWFVLFLWLGHFVFTWLGFTTRWTEEVQLSDGSVIVVSRETIREGGGDEIVSNPSGSKPKTYRLYFKNPDESGKEIEWHSIKKEGTWPEIPLILDREAGAFVVFSTLGGVGGCLDYFKYLYRNNVWIEEALPIRPALFPERKTNLLISDYKGMPSHITQPIKNKENTDVRKMDFIRVGPKRPSCL